MSEQVDIEKEFKTLIAGLENAAGLGNDGQIEAAKVQIDIHKIRWDAAIAMIGMQAVNAQLKAMR